jgi:hypothetical protein
MPAPASSIPFACLLKYWPNRALENTTRVFQVEKAGNPVNCRDCRLRLLRRPTNHRAAVGSGIAPVPRQAVPSRSSNWCFRGARRSRWPSTPGAFIAQLKPSTNEDSRKTRGTDGSSVKTAPSHTCSGGPEGAAKLTGPLGRSRGGGLIAISCQLERCWRGFLGWRVLTTDLSSPSSPLPGCLH